ncbi:hypothetical protein BKA66DRAFT_197691 [Pyrenochaeta sp. MPI-SDFR-AT-0127]|nr:hypothetical protein BKA66DRAFT_197691 [Pyrenochaeta sp. MPI-SDFR-AT-0127]
MTRLLECFIEVRPWSMASIGLRATLAGLGLFLRAWCRCHTTSCATFGVQRSAWFQGIPPGVKSCYRPDFAQAVDLGSHDNSADGVLRHCCS